jgi:hypothetical protein
MKEFDSILRELIPAKVKDFAKLVAGEPYRFDGWEDDRSGSACLYYSFSSRSPDKLNRKRVVISELHTAFQHLRNTGAFDRKSFERLCPTSRSAGSCGFAVMGRVFEALGVARFFDREHRFLLIDVAKPASLCD